MKTKILILLGLICPLGAAHAQGEDMEAAGKTFASVCSNCHGPTGRGMASFPSLAGRDAEYISTRLEQYRSGEKVGPNSALMMPMAADLSDSDIAGLATYISTEFQ